MILTSDEIKRLQKAVKSNEDIIVYVGDWLAHLSLFSDAQIYDILRFIQPTVLELQKKFQASSPVFGLLSIADSRYISITGISQFWDVKEAEVCETLSRPAVTYISCDLFALMSNTQGKQNGKQQPVATG